MDKRSTDPCPAQAPCCPISTQTVTSLGDLPQTAALAAGYVPSQKPNCVQYGSKEALEHGTLYPALFLPFKNMYRVCELPDTPQVQLMALDFAIVELGLYLDTHPTDTDALEMRGEYLALFRKLKKSYEKQYGPLQNRDADDADYYSWVCDPWPWNKGREV